MSIGYAVVALTSWLAAGGNTEAGGAMKLDQDEVVRLEQEFMAAWNRGDAKGAAAVFAEDGVRVGAFGDVAQGRAAIEAAYAKLLKGPMQGASATWQPSVRLIAPNIALAEGPLTIHPPGGASPINGYALDIWKKEGGKWRMLEGHPKLFPPAPPGK